MGPGGFHRRAVAARRSMNTYASTNQMFAHHGTRSLGSLHSLDLEHVHPATRSVVYRGDGAEGRGKRGMPARALMAPGSKEKRQLARTYAFSSCYCWWRSVRPCPGMGSGDLFVRPRLSCLLLLCIGACFALSHRFLHPGCLGGGNEQVRRHRLGGNPAR